MAKNNFLLVDLNEEKTKKVAETITSPTSRKILNYLTEKEDSEANIAKNLGIPISTVHYHLQKLQQAGLVVVEEFHYSKKGREINHYKLANKYIIIAPKKVSGLKQKLRGILPVAILSLGISAVLKWVYSNPVAQMASTTVAKGVSTAKSEAVPEMLKAMPESDLAAPIIQEAVSKPDIALWFLLGSFSAIGLYLIVVLVKEYWKK